MIANRRRPGTTSRKSSSRLPARSVAWSRQAGDVAARSRQTRDQAGADRVSRRREDDRDDRCRLLCREDRRGSRRDNDIDLETDELGGDLSGALAAALRPAILDRDGATLDPTEFAQSLHKSGGPLALRPKAWSRPGTRWSAVSPPAARAPRAATPPRRREAR